MAHLLDGALGVAIGVFIALIFDLLATPNPAKIPLHRVFGRSLFGIVLYFVFWFFVAYAVLWGMPETGAPISIVVAMLLPQTSRLKDSLIDIKFAEKFPKFFRAVQYHDEITRKYFIRMVNREERRATSRVLEKHDLRLKTALDRLYEHHLAEIVQHSAKISRPEARKRVRQLAHVGHPVIKCRLLMRYLGYTEFFQRLESVAFNPQQICSDWPIEVGNRRQNGDRRRLRTPHEPERRVVYPNGRRHLDNSDTVDLLLREVD